MNDQQQGELMDERQVAKRLGVTTQCMQKWRFEKRGPEWIRIGNRVRYDPEAVQKFIDERRIKPTDSV